MTAELLKTAVIDRRYQKHPRRAETRPSDHLAVRNCTVSTSALLARRSLRITRLSPGEVRFASRRYFSAASIVILGSSENFIRKGHTPQQSASWRRTSSLGVKAKMV